MSFPGKCTVRCLGNQFQYCLLIRYIKIPIMLKRQQFKDSKNNAINSKVSKRPYVDKNDNEKEQNSNKYQNKDDRYVLFLSHPEKESNR